jgi:hypothetical protein
VVVEGRPPIPLAGEEGPLSCLAKAIADELDPPYRVVGVRQEGDTWGVGAVGIEVIELPADTKGDELTLTVTQEGERALEIDGESSPDANPALEEAAGARFDAYFVRASRLEGQLWEIGLDPL